MAQSTAPDRRIPAFQLLGSFLIAGGAGWLLFAALLLGNENIRQSRRIDVGVGTIFMVAIVPTLVQIAIGIGLYRESRWVAIPFAALTGALGLYASVLYIRTLPFPYILLPVPMLAALFTPTVLTIRYRSQLS
jgi:hypothetical protein